MQLQGEYAACGAAQHRLAHTCQPRIGQRQAMVHTTAIGEDALGIGPGEHDTQRRNGMATARVAEISQQVRQPIEPLRLHLRAVPPIVALQDQHGCTQNRLPPRSGQRAAKGESEQGAADGEPDDDRCYERHGAARLELWVSSPSGIDWPIERQWIDNAPIRSCVQEGSRSWRRSTRGCRC